MHASWPRSTSARRGASRWCGSRAATGSRPIPTWPRTSSGSCSKARPRGCPRRHSRRWRSSRTSSRCRVRSSPAIRGVSVESTLYDARAARLRRRGRSRPRSRSGHPVRHHAAVPRAAGPGLAARPPAAGRVRARAVCRRSARARSAAAHRAGARAVDRARRGRDRRGAEADAQAVAARRRSSRPSSTRRSRRKRSWNRRIHRRGVGRSDASVPPAGRRRRRRSCTVRSAPSARWTRSQWISPSPRLDRPDRRGAAPEGPRPGGSRLAPGV